MQIALYNNKRVYSDEAIIEYGKQQEYTCPCCNEKVILKAGSVKIPYFSHLKGSDCSEEYDNKMSEWHMHCQSLFPKEYREVIITRLIKDLVDDDEKEYFTDETETHIADICYKNYVIEFQHSPMSADTFFERTDFYTRAGYKVIWVFDWSKKKENYDLENSYYYENQKTTNWNVRRAPKTCMYYSPQLEKNDLMICFSYVDFASISQDGKLFKDVLERIVYAGIDKDDSDLSDYSYIKTKNLGTIETLAEYIMSK